MLRKVLKRRDALSAPHGSSSEIIKRLGGWKSWVAWPQKHFTTDKSGSTSKKFLFGAPVFGLREVRCLHWLPLSQPHSDRVDNCHRHRPPPRMSLYGPCTDLFRALLKKHLKQQKEVSSSFDGISSNGSVQSSYQSGASRACSTKLAPSARHLSSFQADYLTDDRCIKTKKRIMTIFASVNEAIISHSQWSKMIELS